MAQRRIIPIQSTPTENPIGVPVEIIPEEPQEPDDTWTDFFGDHFGDHVGVGWRDLGNGGYQRRRAPRLE